MSTWDGFIEWVSWSSDIGDSNNDWLGWDGWVNFRKCRYTHQFLIEKSGDNNLL